MGFTVQLLLSCCASAFETVSAFYRLFWNDISSLQVVLHDRRRERGTGVQRVASGLYRGNEVNCVSGAYRAGLKCAWSGKADESRGALWGERKSSQQGEAGLLLRSPCSLTFYASERLSLSPFSHFYSATPFLRFWERSPTFCFALVKAPAQWSCSASKWTPSYELVPIRTSWAMTESYRACWP